MNIKRFAYEFLGLAVPWIILVAGAIGNIYSPWLYVGCVTWFATAVTVLMGLYK